MTHSPVPQANVDEYRACVPDELVENWEHYDYRAFCGGILRVIGPKLYEETVGH